MLQRRIVGMILAGFAMVLIVAAVLPRGWWRSHQDIEHVHIGLRSVELCDRAWNDERSQPRAQCRERTLEAIYQDPDDEYQGRRPNNLGAFSTVGMLLFGGGLLTAAMLGLGAVLAYHSRDRRLPRALTTAITVAAASVGALTLVFLLFRPDSFSLLPYGPSPLLALLGSVIGVAGGRCLAIYEPSFEPTRPVVPGSPLIPLVVVGLGALLAIGSTTIAPWWTHTKQAETLQLAPRWVEECDDDGCKSASIVRLADRERGPGGNKFFVQMGAVLHHLSVLALVLGLLAIALTVAGQPVTGGLSPARWLLGLGAVFLACSLLFLGSRPEALGKFELTWGAAVAILGGLGLLAGGILLGRWVPPASDPLAFDPTLEAAATTTPGAAVPSCPSCTAPMAWAGEHRRFFCARCRVYV